MTDTRRLLAERIRLVTDTVIEQYRPALEALGHLDSCSDCSTYRDCQRHLAVLRISSPAPTPAPETDLG